jgi:hypothetical protein
MPMNQLKLFKPQKTALSGFEEFLIEAHLSKMQLTTKVTGINKY